MSFPSPSLDDRKFQDLVDEAKRLIPKYCPEWTNHNLSDPGIALIELFAWMTELTLYRINQVPDRFYTKFLDLVGIEPYPAAPARTELTFWLSAENIDPITVPGGTQVGTPQTDERPSIMFMTDSNLRIAPARLTACATAVAGGAYTDRWEDLQYEQQRVRCFPSDPPRTGDAMYFGFEESLAGNVIRLDIDATTEGLGVKPADPPLEWQVWSGEQWIPCRIYGDTTGGLNRRGAVTLLVPLAHEVLTLGPTRAYWLRATLVPPEEDQPPYQASPEIATFRATTLGGTVPARHGQPAPGESLGRSDGDPGQIFRVSRTPVLPRHLTETVRVISEEGATDWTEVGDFTDSTPEDRHFVWDSTDGEIRFGPRVTYPDGRVRQHGAIPPNGAEILVTRYRFGGGSIGNVGSGTLTTLKRTIPFIDRVENLIPATGGVDTETIANAKVRAPMQLRTGERAVTARDFEHLTRQAAPAVARARALQPERPGGPVRLLIVPEVGSPPESLQLDDFAIPDELVGQIAAYLDERRTLGTSVEITAPFYQGVSVVARIRARSGQQPDLVRQRALDRLYGFINPTIGGAEGTGWPFSRDLNAGAVFQRLASVEGVQSVEEVLLFEADMRTERRYGRGKERIELAANSLFMSLKHQVVVE